MKKLKAIDLFCGAGGLSLGMKKAGVEIVLANEIEKDFAKSYHANHLNTKLIVGDIHQVDFKKEIKNLGLKNQIDMVFGGPPCQGFSTLGKKNFFDARNSLFGQFLRVIDETEPSVIVFENVSGFKKLYNGQVFESLLEELDMRGFKTISAVLDAVKYGLPQFRQRTIVIGWKNNSDEIKFPESTHGTESLIDTNLKPFVTLMDAISDLPEIFVGEESNEYFTEPQNEYQKNMRDGINYLSEHSCSDYGEKMQKILSLIPIGGSVENLPMELRPQNYFKNTYARLLLDKPAPTITRNLGTPSSSRCVHPFQNRALSTREGARIQGFSDSYKFIGSRSSKNLQIGNAVPPVLGFVIAKSIIESMVETEQIVSFDKKVQYRNMVKEKILINAL